MSDPRVVFFGSPDFAVPTLEALIDSRYRPVGVVTQPDRPSGRGRKLTQPPVKIVAGQAGIPVVQPRHLHEPEAIAEVGALEPELQIIAAYGQILSPAVLALPVHGTLNVHASLLPRWRGAAPVAAAILAGDTESGATIMLVDETEDTGDIVAMRPEPIREDDTTGSLSERLATIGAQLLLETIPRWLAGEITPAAQDDAAATRARRLQKSAGELDWARPADEIARSVRAFTPWPGASTRLRGKPLRILAATANAEYVDAAPGTILDVNGSLRVATGAGVLAVGRLQRSGKRPLPAADFARGERDLRGTRLGDDDA